MTKKAAGRKAKKNGRHQVVLARLPISAVKQTAAAMKAGSRNVRDFIALVCDRYEVQRS